VVEEPSLQIPDPPRLLFGIGIAIGIGIEPFSSLFVFDSDADADADPDACGKGGRPDATAGVQTSGIWHLGSRNSAPAASNLNLQT